MELTKEQTELCLRLREDLDVTDVDAIAAADLIELLAAHSAGAQEPVVWRHKWTNDHAAEWAYKEAGPKTDELRIGIPGVLGPDSHRECWEPLYAQPQPMTDAARDVLAKAVARYDELTGSIQGCTDGGCLIRKPEGMHTNGGCRCARDHMKMQRAMYAANELRNALAEIERLERAKGE